MPDPTKECLCGRPHPCVLHAPARFGMSADDPRLWGWKERTSEGEVRLAGRRRRGAYKFDGVRLDMWGGDVVRAS